MEFVESDYRPVRTYDPPEVPCQHVLLRKSVGNTPLYPEDGWLWTAASDGRMMVGWILRDYELSSSVPWDYSPSNVVAPPKLEVGGLDTGVEYELVWFDDRRGEIIYPVVDLGTGSSFLQTAPNTETGGFGKSIAFLIQPKGYTPQKVWAKLPNEPIGQILIDTVLESNPPNSIPDEDIQLPYYWHEEKPSVSIPQQTLRFVARTRCSPSLDVSQHKYIWRKYLFTGGQWVEQGTPQVGDGVDYFDYQPEPKGSWRIEVEVLDKTRGDIRVSGDIIHLDVN